jgi:hypothetical protein
MDPETNWRAWQFWFSVGQYIIAIVVGAYVWISNRDKARVRDIKRVEECTAIDIEGIKETLAGEIKNVGTRVTRLENSTISHEDLGKVYDRINGVSDQVSAQTEAINGLKRAVDMIHQHLLNSGGKQ